MRDVLDMKLENDERFVNSLTRLEQLGLDFMLLYLMVDVVVAVEADGVTGVASWRFAKFGVVVVQLLVVEPLPPPPPPPYAEGKPNDETDDMDDWRLLRDGWTGGPSGRQASIEALMSFTSAPRLMASSLGLMLILIFRTGSRSSESESELELLMLGLAWPGCCCF